MFATTVFESNSAIEKNNKKPALERVFLLMIYMVLILYSQYCPLYLGRVLPILSLKIPFQKRQKLKIQVDCNLVHDVIT
jgi:hypothetical protein